MSGYLLDTSTCIFLLRGNRSVEEHLQQQVTIRLPLIPSFNTDGDRQHSQQQLAALGYSDFNLFNYIVPRNMPVI